MVAKKKNKVGPPNKQQQIKNKIQRMEDSLADAILKGNQKIVSNYLTYLSVLDDCATGKMKNASPTNQLSSCKVLIEKCEDLLQPKQSAEEQETTSEETVTPVVAQLISLQASEG